MATVNLNWTNPGDISDIAEIVIYRATGNRTSLNDATFRGVAEELPMGTDNVDLQKSGGILPNSCSDTTADAGAEYTYGAFSKNGGGIGPGDLTNSVVNT